MVASGIMKQPRRITLIRKKSWVGRTLRTTHSVNAQHVSLFMSSIFLTLMLWSPSRAVAEPAGEMRGVRSALQKVPDGSSLRILLVHGVGCHPAGWSRLLQKKIADRLGFSEVTDSAEPNETRQVLIFRSPQDPMRPPLLTADSNPPAANDVCGTLSNYKKYGDGSKGELPTLIIDSFSDGHKTLSFFEVTWSPLVLDLKSKHLAYDVDKDETKGRAIWNGWMKDQLVDSLFSDAIYYLGVGRQNVLNIVAFSLCRLWQAHPALSSTGEAVCDAGDDAYRTEVQKNRYMVISESLGSQIVFDALRHDSLIHAVDSGLQGTDSIFMLSNQLPLLELGQQLPETIRPTNVPNLVGDHFTKWLALRRQHSPDVGSTDHYSMSSQAALTELQRDIDDYKRVFAIRLYQSEFQRALNVAKSDVTKATEENTIAQKAVDALQSQRTKLNEQLTLLKVSAEEATKLFNKADSTLKQVSGQLSSAIERANLAKQEYDDARTKTLRDGRIATTPAIDAAYGKYAAAITNMFALADPLLTKCIVIRGYYIDRDNPEASETLQGRQQLCNNAVQNVKQHIDIAQFVNKRLSRPGNVSPTAQLSTDTKLASLLGQLAQYNATPPTTAVSYNKSLELFRKDAAEEASAFNAALSSTATSEADLAHAIAAGLPAAHDTVKDAVSAALLKDSAIIELQNSVANSNSVTDKARKVSDSAQHKYNLDLLRGRNDELARETSNVTRAISVLSTPIREAEARQRVTSSKLDKFKTVEAEISARFESPRDDGIAGFYALLQQGEGPLKDLQAADIAGKANRETDPSVRDALMEIQSLLVAQASMIQRPQFVALTDPNDLLGFTISPEFGARYPGAGFLNRTVKNEHTFFRLYADPDKAHSGYLDRDSVLRLIVDGQ